jgi:hypothetical protein
MDLSLMAFLQHDRTGPVSPQNTARPGRQDPPTGREHDSCRSDSALLRHETQAEPANASRIVLMKPPFGQTLQFLTKGIGRVSGRCHFLVKEMSARSARR